MLTGKACNHVTSYVNNFEDFVSNKPFVNYYHLWLQEISHLLSLAVPTVSAYFYMSDTVLLPTAHSRLPSTIVRVPS